MLPTIMRSVIARGGRSFVTRRNFSTPSNPGNGPTQPEVKSLAGKLHKHLGGLPFYTLFGYSVYSVWEVRDLLLYYERRERAEQELRHGNLVKKQRDVVS